MKKHGFTLIELVVVMAIIAVLSMLIIGAIVMARRVSIETTHRSNLRTVRVALEAKYANDKKYPLLNNWGPIGYVSGGFSFMDKLGLTANDLTNTCNDPQYTDMPLYGNRLIGKNNPSWDYVSNIAKSKGFEVEGSDIILMLFDYQCKNIIEYVGVP